MMWWKARISDEQFTSVPDHLAAVIADLALLTQRVSRLETVSYTHLTLPTIYSV